MYIVSAEEPVIDIDKYRQSREVRLASSLCPIKLFPSTQLLFHHLIILIVILRLIRFPTLLLSFPFALLNAFSRLLVFTAEPCKPHHSVQLENILFPCIPSLIHRAKLCRQLPASCNIFGANEIDGDLDTIRQVADLREPMQTRSIQPEIEVAIH